MISDKERRRIANELREAGAWRGCFRSCLELPSKTWACSDSQLMSRQHGETFTGALPI